MYLRGFIYGPWGWAKGPWLCLMAKPFLICLVFLCFCIVSLLSLIKFSLWISERPSMLKFSYKQDVGDTRVSPWEGSPGSYWVSVSQFYISCILSQDTLQLIVECYCMLCCAVFSRSVMFDSCAPMACSPQGYSVHGILHLRILEWIAMPSSRGSSQPRDRTQVS